MFPAGVTKVEKPWDALDGMVRIKDLGRRTNADTWTEGFHAAMAQAQSEDGEQQAIAGEELRKHLHTENEKHYAVEHGVLPVLEKLLKSENYDAAQAGKICLFGFGYHPQKNRTSMADVEAHYRSTWLDSERVAAARKAFDDVDATVSWGEGKALMQAEVVKQGGKIGALTWGETDFGSLAIMLGFVAPKAGENFLDLGAGLGKVLCGAQMLCDFDKLLGIELIEGTAAAGQTLVNKFSEARGLPEGKVELQCGDFLEADWSSYDVVFSNASMFPKDLLKAICKKMDNELKEGTRVIFITSALKYGKRLGMLNAKRMYCKHQEEGDTPATFFLYKMQSMDLLKDGDEEAE